MAAKSENIPTEAMKRYASKIEERMKELHDTYGEPTHNTFKESGSFSLDIDIQKDLGVYGVHFTSFEHGSHRQKRIYNENLKSVVKLMHLFIYETEEETPESKAALAHVTKTLKALNFTDLELQFAALCSKWNSKAGFGNSSFRFLFGQFIDKNLSPKFTIAGQAVEFSYNPFHQINLDLLASIPEIFTSFKELYPESNPMISWDSQKARFMHSSFKDATAPTLTGRHRDIYAKDDGTELDRKQAMVILERPNPKTTPISLGYVLFSNDHKVRKYLAKFFKKEYNKFSSVDHPLLNPIFDRYWRSLKNGLVVWDQSTIHYEAVPEELPGNRLLYRIATDKDGTPYPEASQSKGKLHNEHLPEPNFRAVIGTHTPYKLSRDDLLSLASLSLQGWCPEIYTHNRPNNKRTVVDGNVVNHKTTQFAVPRKVKKMEEKAPKIDHSLVLALPKIYQEFYGVYDERLYEISLKNGISVHFIENLIHETAQDKHISSSLLTDAVIKLF